MSDARPSSNKVKGEVFGFLGSNDGWQHPDSIHIIAMRLENNAMQLGPRPGQWRGVLIEDDPRRTIQWICRHVLEPGAVGEPHDLPGHANEAEAQACARAKWFQHHG